MPMRSPRATTGPRSQCRCYTYKIPSFVLSFTIPFFAFFSHNNINILASLTRLSRSTGNKHKMAPATHFTLNNGKKIPSVGLGTVSSLVS